jgi:outer membrane protein assembly factor BamB
LYVESFDHNTYAFDALSGEKIWSAPAGNIVMTTPLVSSGLVIVGSGTGMEEAGSATQALWGRLGGDAIYAYDARTGAVRWRFDTVGEDMSTGAVVPVGGKKEFVFCNGDDHLYALDVNSGALRWRTKIPGACLMSNLSYADGLLYGSSGFSWELISGLAQHHDSAAYRTLWTWAARPTDGALVWSNSPGSVHGGTTVGGGMVFDEFAEPTSWRDPGAVITTADNALRLNVVNAFGQRSGALRWQYVSSGGPMVQIGSRVTEYQGLYVAGVLYQALPLPSQFAALDAKSGGARWRIKTQAPVKMTAVMRDGLLYFGDESGYLYVVRAVDGSIQEQVKFPNYFTCSPPVIVGDTLYVENGSSIYALRLDRLRQDAVTLSQGAPPGPSF